MEVEQAAKVIDLCDDDSDDEENDAELLALSFVDKRVAKYLDCGILYFGTVSSFSPSHQNKGGKDLFCIDYDDGFKEDMSHFELELALCLYEQEKALDDQKPAATGSDDDTKPPATARRVTLTTPPTENYTEDSEESELDECSAVSSTNAAAAQKRHWSDDTDDDDDDEMTPKRLCKFSSSKVRKKYATLEQQAWLGDDEDFSGDDSSDGEDLQADEGFNRFELEPTQSTRRRRSEEFGVPPPPPVALTFKERHDLLQKIDKPADRALQKLLLDEDFQFQLLPHQFLAVRMIAGVPIKFPLHYGSYVMQAETATMEQAIKGLDLDENKIKEKGVLIADDMGLGKTVEAIAGAILRNALASTKGQSPRPTLIVSPNDAVQVQWRDTLIKNGVLLERIHMFQVGQQSRDFDKAIFLLLTRYKLQTEVKRVCEKLEDAEDYPHLVKSVLFPFASIEDLKRLYVQYKDENRKTRVQNPYRIRNSQGKKESVPDTVTRLVKNCQLRMSRQGEEPIFETIIIDEAHFLKNITTFWGMGAALISAHANRSAPLTGTPYNNGPSDLAAMMTFVDPSLACAKKTWWANNKDNPAKIADWHGTKVVRRRKEDVLQQLVPKHVGSRLVSQYAAELCTYDHYEGILVDIMKEFRKLLEDDENPILRERLKELFVILMALLSNMRSANIHAMLPGGREYTKQFSPTRYHLRAMEARPKTCVCCDQSMRPSIPIVSDDDDDDEKKKKDKRGNRRRRFRGGTANVDEPEEFQEADDDALEMFEEEEEKLLPLPCSLCEARNGPVSHYAHAKCIENLEAAGDSCPRCKHAKRVITHELPAEANHKYCTHIDGGFVGSSKINAIVKWYRDEVPKDDKVLILSFFKGGLDLLEGIFCHDLGVDCARFDGDFDKRTSIGDLERFKKESKCKILLATVQSGGVGLNIVEANHVAFVDRWYNPFVHQQAEDRTHRIGQTKDVYVSYFDCAATVDEAMLQINKVKQENSAILLADGFEIGHNTSLSYKQLSGVLGNLLSVIRSHRNGFIELGPDNKHLPIPPTPPELIANALAGRIARNTAKGRDCPDAEEDGDDSETENGPAAGNGLGAPYPFDDSSEEEDDF